MVIAVATSITVAMTGLTPLRLFNTLIISLSGDTARFIVKIDYEEIKWIKEREYYFIWFLYRILIPTSKETKLERGKINRIDLENTREDIIRFGLQLFDIFSNLDTLRIFLYAYDGIRNSKRAMEELGLTPKRYYSRLRELVEMGVLKKGEEGYEYTPLGKALYQLGYYLLDVLKNRERLKLIGELMKSDLLDFHETKQILEIISGESEGLELVLRSLYREGKMGSVERIGSYDELVDQLVRDIESAEKSINLASRYIDVRVVEACTKAMRRGIEFKVILSKGNLSSKFNKLKLLLSPSILKMMMKIISSNIAIDKFIREGEIPYSFCIIDGRTCFFELPSIVEGEFSIAFRVVDEGVAGRFKKLFHKLWNKTNTKMMLNFFNSLEGNNTDQHRDLEQQVEGESPPIHNSIEIDGVPPPLH